MTVTIRLEGSKQLRAALRNMSDEVREEVGKAVETTAIKLRKDVVRSLEQVGTGTMYYRIFDANTGYTTIYAGDSEGYVASVKGKLNLSTTHRASAAGMPPAKDTGRLLNSIEFDKIGDLTATVGTKVEYAEHLEYGTISMHARPFFRPAVERIRPTYEDLIEQAIKRATR